MIRRHSCAPYLRMYSSAWRVPVALVSMTASSSEETSRGLDFLLSRERLNVAVSRGKGLSLVFASPRLLHTHCATVEQMRLVNALCALPDAGALVR